MENERRRDGMAQLATAGSTAPLSPQSSYLTEGLASEWTQTGIKDPIYSSMAAVPGIPQPMRTPQGARAGSVPVVQAVVAAWEVEDSIGKRGTCTETATELLAQGDAEEGGGKDW